MHHAVKQHRAMSRQLEMQQQEGVDACSAAAAEQRSQQERDALNTVQLPVICTHSQSSIYTHQFSTSNLHPQPKQHIYILISSLRHPSVVQGVTSVQGRHSLTEGKRNVLPFWAF
jgi:hypothetical protein